jgi:hypothetical protein
MDMKVCFFEFRLGGGSMNESPSLRLRGRLGHRGFGVLFALLFILLAVAPSRPAHAGAILGWKWSSIGPEPECCWGPYPGGETGRTTAIAVNPQNPDDIWIGTAGGGADDQGLKRHQTGFGRKSYTPCLTSAPPARERANRAAPSKAGCPVEKEQR